MSALISSTIPVLRLPENVEAWFNQLRTRGVLPVIAIAGSRGKSTVVQMLDEILTEAGLRTATWTDAGVRVLGRKQRGELLPWTRALRQIASGTLDLAVQELDWDTVHAVGLPRGAYPIVGVTNLCANSDACLLRPETIRAARALQTIREAADPEAVFVLNGDDWVVSGGNVEHEPNTILATLSRDSPIVRSHLRRHGSAVWARGDQVVFGSDDDEHPVMVVSQGDFSPQGLLGFQAINALVAIGLARAIGVGFAPISTALGSFTADPERLPGSFNFLSFAGATIVVDRPAAPWFLRHPLRAIGHLPSDRWVRVVGRLDGVADDDLAETGRLLGRGGGLVIIHDEVGGTERCDLFLHGIAANDFPPAVVQTKTETAALTAMLKVLRPEDAVYILADDPRSVLRRLKRAEMQHEQRSSSTTTSSPRADASSRLDGTADQGPG